MRMFIQTSGKLAKASHDIWAAAKRGDIAECERIYTVVTGEKAPEDCDRNYWILCGCDRVRTDSKPSREGVWQSWEEY